MKSIRTEVSVPDDNVAPLYILFKRLLIFLVWRISARSPESLYPQPSSHSRSSSSYPSAEKHNPPIYGEPRYRRLWSGFCDDFLSRGSLRSNQPASLHTDHIAISIPSPVCKSCSEGSSPLQNIERRIPFRGRPCPLVQRRPGTPAHCSSLSETQSRLEAAPKDAPPSLSDARP